MGGTLLKIREFCSINYSYLQRRFREIPTSKQRQFFLGMTCFSICMLCLFTNTLQSCTTPPLTAYSPSRVVAPQRYYGKCVATKVVSRQPNNMSTSCCYVATSDRGYGWEDYPTSTLLPDGKRASGVRNVAITRRHRTLSTTFAAIPLLPLSYRAWQLRGESRWDNTSSPSEILNLLDGLPIRNVFRAK